jgi:hypothetical protein
VIDGLPAIALVAAMLALRFQWVSLVCGGVLLGTVWLFLWRGKGWSRGVGPGLVLGWIPLLVPTVALRMGHVCTGGHCHNFCRLACGISGVVCGLLLVRLLRRSGHQLFAWMASGILLVTASVAGCQCMGIASTATFAIALAVSAISVKYWTSQ